MHSDSFFRLTDKNSRSEKKSEVRQEEKLKSVTVVQSIDHHTENSKLRIRNPENAFSKTLRVRS